MADDQERLVLQMSADLRRFEKEMARARGVTERRLREAEQAAVQADRNLARVMGGVGQSMVDALKSSLAGLAPALASAFSATQIIQYADAWTQGRNALAAAGIATADLATRQSELVDLANETRTATGDTISLYRRLSIATQEMGMAQSDALRLTELLNKSFQTSGSSTQEAASAALQLSQALASGVLQGDELRSLRENAPQLAQAIAKAMGVSIGKLKELGAEGKITSQVVANAILGAGAQIDAKFAATSVTVGQALTVLNNELGRFVGQADSGVSATGRMAEAIVALSRNLDRIVPIVGVLVSLLGAKMVLALTANSGAMIANGVAAVRLAAFQTAMTASMTGTTRATVLATAATRAFSTALAANPVGAAILAVTALAAAFGVLAARQKEADQRVEEYRSSMGGARDALNAYEEAARTAANATGENAAKMQQSAEAARIDALYRLENARAIRAQTAALAEQRAKEALVADQAANRGGSPYPGMMGGQAVQSNQRAIQARREANAAAEAERAASARYEQITKNLRSGAYKGKPVAVAPVRSGSSGSDGGGASGPSAEDLARQRELMALQAQVELLRAQGREEEAKSAQRQIDVLNLTKQFEDAKVPNAKKAAEDQVAALALAEDTSAEIDRLLTASEKRNERRAESLRLQREEQDRQNDALLEQVQFEAELARLSGDPARIQQAERELYIQQRVNDLLRDRVGLITEADRLNAERQASSEYNALERAGVSGDMREEFRRSFVEGMRAALDGDMGGMFESLADRFTDRMLDNLADDLFDLLSQAASGLKSGAGGVSGILSTVGSLFGKRATGGPVTAGQSYIVGERRPEVFVPNVNGTVIPSLNAAMARVQGGGQHTLNTTIKIDLTGANGDDTIRQIAYDAAARGAATAYSRASQDIPAQGARRARQQFVR